MKKLIATLLVLSLAVPAIAADVQLAEDGTISLAIPTGEVVRGLAIVIESENPITDVTDVNPIFNVFMDAAYDAETTVPGSYVIGTGSPVANPDAAGTLDISAGTTTKISLSMGILDELGAQAGAEGTITVAKLATSGLVTITADVLRGGVVGDNVTPDPDGAVLATATVDGGSAPCLGDANGDGYIDGGDIEALIATFNKCDGVAGYNPIFDFNGDGCIDGGDIAGLIAVFNGPCPD